MRKDRKKVVWLGMFLFWICVLLFINRERCNVFISNLFAIREESPEALTYADEMPIGGISIGREIIQPLTFDKRVGHIGIKIGTYRRENHSTYEIRLVDPWGNVLGMAKEDARNMKDNEYYYMKIERLITPGQEYYLKITTDSAEEENVITCYASKSIVNQKHTIVNGIEQEYSLILAFMYGEVNDYTSSIMVALLLSFFGYVIYQLVDGKKYILMLKHIVRSKRTHQGMLVALFLCLLLAILYKERIYRIAYSEGYDSERYVSEALLDDVVVEQNFVYLEEELNCIEVKFALFLQTFQSGVIHFELYEQGNSEVIRSSSVNASRIKTEYVKFSFPNIEDAKGKAYLFKIYTTKVKKENAMSVFYTNDHSSKQTFKIHGNVIQGGNLVFTAGVTHKEYNWKNILIFVCILVGMGLCYFYRFYITKRKLVVLVGMILLVGIGGVGVKAYTIYHELSMDGILKVLLKEGYGEEKTYDPKSKFYEESFSRKVRANGTCYGMMHLIELQNINTRVDTIQIELDGNMEKRSYYISIFLDTGNGYHDTERYQVSYIHRGESEILLHIPYRSMVRSIRIDIGKEVHMGVIEWNEQLVHINKIILNSKIFKETDYSSLLIIGIVILIWSIYFFVRNKKKEKLISISFLIVGILYGLLLSVLIPIAQVPDEDYHVQHTFYAIGSEKIYDQIGEVNKETGVYRMVGISGERVNFLKYKKLLTTYLDSYQLSNIIKRDTLEILKRPGQTIGILIGICFKMSVFWLYFLGELGGLLVYIGICFYALKLLPSKKELMCMIMLLPMALQQAGSFSYDSFNNALSFFLIAYILYLNTRKERITLKDILILTSIGALLFYIKTIYAGLLLLFAIIPTDKYDIRIGKYRINQQWIKENRKKGIVGVGIGGLLFVAIVVILKYEYVILLFQILINITEIIRLLVRSFIEQGEMYFSTMIANFGWADTPVGQWFIVFYVFTMVCFCLFGEETIPVNNTTTYKMGNKVLEKTIVVFTTILMLTVIMFSMLAWSFSIQAINSVTPFDSKIKLLNVINGIQGRYFIPILPLLLFLFPKNTCRMESQKRIFICVSIQSVSIIYISYVLLFRYWIS